MRFLSKYPLAVDVVASMEHYLNEQNGKGFSSAASAKLIEW